MLALLAGRRQDQSHVWLNDGTGVFSEDEAPHPFNARTLHPLHGTLHGMSAGDMNGDGRPDLVATVGDSGNLAEGSGVDVLLAGGTGEFADAVIWTATAGPISRSPAAPT